MLLSMVSPGLLPDIININSGDPLAQELQSELKARETDTSWDPTEGKAVLVQRLKVHSNIVCKLHLCRSVGEV